MPLLPGEGEFGEFDVRQLMYEKCREYIAHYLMGTVPSEVMESAQRMSYLNIALFGVSTLAEQIPTNRHRTFEELAINAFLSSSQVSEFGASLTVIGFTLCTAYRLGRLDALNEQALSLSTTRNNLT